MRKPRRAAPLWLATLAAWTLVFVPLSDKPAVALDGVTADELAKVRAVEASRVAAIEKVYHSVVAIYGNNRQGGGSGVVYDPAGYVLTNYHVTAGAGVEGWGGLADGKLYKWKLIGHDPGGDVAIIKLEGPTPDHQFHYARLADSDSVRVGDFAMAMGNPFILAEDQTPTVTLGIVSGVKRYQPGTGPGGKMLEYGNCIQIDSSINPGNSGGPLFNMQGEVIGINGRGSFEERGRVNVGLGYAISANQCKMFIPDLLATKTCEHGTLDAVFNRRGNNEVVCESINLDSPIAKAGLELGDRLLKFNGETINTTHEFTNIIATLPAHWPVEVVWEHEGQKKSAWVRLTPILYPKPPKPQPAPQPPKPDDKSKPKQDDKSKPKSDEKPAPKPDAPKTEPTPEPKPAPDPNDKSADGFTLDELKQKLERLQAVRAAIQDNPAALKQVDDQIAEVKAKIKEIEAKKQPAKPKEEEALPKGTSTNDRFDRLKALTERRQNLDKLLAEVLFGSGSRSAAKSQEYARLDALPRIEALTAELKTAIADVEASNDLEQIVDKSQSDAVQHLIEKREKLQEVQRANRAVGRDDKHPAQKDLARRIADVNKEIEDQINAEHKALSEDNETEPIDPPKKPEPAKDAPKEQPKEQPKPGPQPQPQPRPTPIPGMPGGPPQPQLEFGKMRDMKINEREALRIVAQHVAFLGGHEALKNIKAIRTTIETRLNDKVMGESHNLSAPDGRSRVERTETHDGAAIKSTSIWDGKRYWQDMGGQSKLTEGDQAKRNTSVAMMNFSAALRSPKPMDHFKRVVLQGSDKAQDRPAYRILFEDKSGNRMIGWFSVLGPTGDFETKLVKVSMADDKDQPRDPAMVIGDYRAVEGVRFPHLMRVVGGLEESIVVDMVTTKLELLRELNDKEFAIPTEAKPEEGK